MTDLHDHFADGQIDRSPLARRQGGDAVMRQPIRVLPEELSTRIAAGEVIERPASVVKELVENALDAGARSIRVDVQGGGLGLIRVGDDGIGLPPGELWLACQRHATSKLSGELAEVRTLGFRGEALPSIAAVAELTIVSAMDSSGLGRRLVMRDGVPVADQPAPRLRGTTVTVRQLFQRVPARLAACAGAQAELTQIGQTVRRLALAAPRVRVALFVDDRMAFQTTGSGDLKTGLIEVYGPGLAGCVLPLGPLEVDGARVEGVITGPEVTRSGRSQVNVIINGRWVQPRGLLHQIEASYRPVLPRGRHPVLALTIAVPPERVDINIHPAKLEVRLVNERTIAVAAGDLIRDALGRRPISLHLTPTGADALPRVQTVAEDAPPYDDNEPIVTPNLPPLRLVGQVQDRLLLLEAADGFYLVDQHRAHERILFERFAAMHGKLGPDPVALPEPLLLELRPTQMARFSRRLEQLAGLGFECEAFGGRTFLVRRAPILPGMLGALSDPDDVLGALRALPDDDPGEGEDWRERLLVNLACRTAVRRGRTLDRAAMRGLVETLGHAVSPAVCPHGSPLLMHVSGALLEKQFGW